MQMYREIVDPQHAFEPLDVGQMGEVTRAARSNCILDTTRLAREGIDLQPVRAAVTSALRELALALKAKA